MNRKPLTDAERAILTELIRTDRPRLSYGQIRAKFRQTTGRNVARSTIVYLAARGGYSRWSGGNHLTPGQREILDVLVRDAKPHYCRREIARQFLVLAGRPISPRIVRLRCKALGCGEAKYPRTRHAFGFLGGEHRPHKEARPWR